jgi:hypothetical protein
VRQRITSAELEELRQAQKASERLSGVLRAYQRAGRQDIPIEDVLAMLGQEAVVPEPVAAVANPLADSLTGAMWAGPPGSAPPGI